MGGLVDVDEPSSTGGKQGAPPLPPPPPGTTVSTGGMPGEVQGGASGEKPEHTVVPIGTYPSGTVAPPSLTYPNPNPPAPLPAPKGTPTGRGQDMGGLPGELQDAGAGRTPPPAVVPIGVNPPMPNPIKDFIKSQPPVAPPSLKLPTGITTQPPVSPPSLKLPTSPPGATQPAQFKFDAGLRLDPRFANAVLSNPTMLNEQSGMFLSRFGGPLVYGQLTRLSQEQIAVYYAIKGGSANAQEISDTTGLDVPTVNQALKVLKLGGLVSATA